MANDVTTVGPPASTQAMVSALLMAGFTDNATIANMIHIAGWESNATPKINAGPGESPKGFTGCKSVGVWQINYCPARDKGTIREQAANDPGNLVLNARAAFQVSNGGKNLDIWTTWKEHNASGTTGNPTIDASGAAALAAIAAQPVGVGSIDPCGERPTGATLSIFPYMFCRLQQDVKRGGEMLLGVVLIVVGLALLGKIAGDKTGIGQAIQKAGAIAETAA